MKGKDYKVILLNQLIDRYESSKLFRGENQVTVHVEFKFTKGSIGAYFDETKYEIKEEVNEICKNLESQSLVKIIWKKYERNNIIEKLRLNTNHVNEVYRILNRVNKKELEQHMISILTPYVNHDSWLSNFVETLITRIKEAKSIQRYFDLNKTDEAIIILQTLQAILEQREEISKRMFSIALFKNSKLFEQLESKITMIMKEFGPYDEDTDVLAEENIMNNPGFIYLKGNGVFQLGSQIIDLNQIKGEIGLSTQLVEQLMIKELNVKHVLTIENLTSFHTYQPQDELVIYLGGYHNRVRRQFLQKLYHFNSQITFLHWGDIDLGGFRILNHLKSKTGIPFKSYKMDLDTLKHYESYGMKMDDSYMSKLKNLLDQPEFKEFYDVIHYMIQNNVRLEQEIVN